MKCEKCGQELSFREDERRMTAKENHTLEFTMFRLHSDSTLQKMKKDELIRYIHMLHYNWNVADEQLANMLLITKAMQRKEDEK